MSWLGGGAVKDWHATQYDSFPTDRKDMGSVIPVGACPALAAGAPDPPAGPCPKGAAQGESAIGGRSYL